jgi:hypothetical protein
MSMAYGLWRRINLQLGWLMNLWRLWAKALGEKAGTTDQESDLIAWIRTIIVLLSVVTNIFICAGIIKHWNQ